MNTTLSIALSHQVAKRRQMDVIANNIANMSTTGFKRESIRFGQFVREAQGNLPKAFRQVTYVQDFGITRTMTDGRFETTGNPLDIALSGDGFFQVQRDNGDMAYTRNGHLTISEDYTLVTSSGQEIMDDDGQVIKIPPNVSDITIASDGTISAPSVGQIAKLNVVTFDDNSKLQKIGNNMFNADGPPLPSPNYNIIQGAIESSNVQPIIEITRMIQVSRSYIQTAKLMERLQDSESKAINQLAKIG